jgi:hypothetical protein
MPKEFPYLPVIALKPRQQIQRQAIYIALSAQKYTGIQLVQRNKPLLKPAEA